MWVFGGAFLNLFLIPTVIAAGIYYVSKFSKQNPSNLRLALINFVIIYLLIIISVCVYDIYLKYKVSTFDLDGDGFFTSEEWTPEYAKYSSRLVNDVGRNFAPITGFVFSFLHSIIFLVILTLCRMIKRKRQ